jgi:type IX secretion system PorP/SprF family membrane protein
MKRIILFTICVVAAGKISAQQDAMYTHYMYNTLGVNPAYAGTRQAMTVTGLHRSQWVGFDGAPVTQTFTMHTPLMNEKLGVGVSLINDKIGPSLSTSIYGDFAYHIKLAEKKKLSFGLKGGGSLFNSNLSSLQTDQQNDLAFSSNVQSRFLPNFGFGMYYYEEKFYAGISIPKLIENKFLTDKITGTTKLFWEKRHYFMIAGAMLDLSDRIQLNPTTLIKVTAGSPVQADLTAQIHIDKKFAIGAMYRTNSAAGLILGIKINEQFHAGYSFDWSFVNKTGKYNSGTHEIVLRYDFVYKDKEKIKSPRYF